MFYSGCVDNEYIISHNSQILSFPLDKFGGALIEKRSNFANKTPEPNFIDEQIGLTIITKLYPAKFCIDGLDFENRV